MIQSNQKTSLLVPYQLPEFVRDNPDYQNFVYFLKAYYEWLELANTSNSQIDIATSQSQGVTYATKNLSNYFDVDNTINDFLDYFIKDFLPYFPEDALISKDKAIKVARQLYQSKGTPASYEFLFRILYNSSFDYYNTGDATLKASDGQWYVPKSLKLATSDPRFLQLETQIGGNYRVFGETSKSFATIEYVTFAGSKTEIFISNIERLFESGEFCRIVDGYNQDVIINGSNLRAKLVGQISSLNVDPNNRGLFYSPGDPVVVYGGLSPDVVNPVGATAVVGTTTSGSVQKVNMITGGYGYTNDSSVTNQPANTILFFSNLNSGAKSPIAIVGSVDPSNISNVASIPLDTITLKRYHYLGNIAYSQTLQSNSIPSFGANTLNPYTGLYTQQSYQFANSLIANANTSLANAFTFVGFSTFPISSVIVENGGGGITTDPTVTAESLYGTDVPGNQAYLESLGILAPIQIVNPGVGYRANDKIIISGGSGYGAFANVTTVDSSGEITGVSYVYDANTTIHKYPLGGMGYSSKNLPTSITIVSTNPSATNAVLSIPGVLGDGATFSLTLDRAGSVTTINVLYPGDDYVAAPNVSLRVQDIVVSNVVPGAISTLKQSQEVYQGANVNVATYTAYYDSLQQLTHNNDPTQALWNLRTYNYNSKPVANTITQGIIKFANTNFYVTMSNTSYVANTFYAGSPLYDINGVKTYGDGTAVATSKFLNGLVIGQGQYLNSHGQPSGFSVLQSQDYNSFTYQITVEKEIQKYREILLNLLHPAGTNLIGRYSNRSKANFNFGASEFVYRGDSLYYYTQASSSNVQISVPLITPGSTGYQPSNNIIIFNNLSGANLGNIIFANTSTISLTSTTGDNVTSLITSVDYANNKATISSNVFLAFANVANVSYTGGSNTININKFTNSFNIINNGVYANTEYPILDIVHTGDTISVSPVGGFATVSSVDYVHNVIYLNSNLSGSGSQTGNLTVYRTFSAGGSSGSAYNVIIYNTIGTQYFPEITDGYGNSITTEAGDYILLG